MNARKSDPKLHVSLRLGEHKYACDVINVQEIIHHPQLEPSLDGPELLIGIYTSSRGPFPVLDLLKRPPDECRLSEMSMVVVEITGELLGLLVDDLDNVVEIDLSDRRPVAGGRMGVEDGLLEGVAAVKGSEYYLLDLERILLAYTGADLNSAREAGDKNR